MGAPVSPTLQLRVDGRLLAENEPTPDARLLSSAEFARLDHAAAQVIFRSFLRLRRLGRTFRRRSAVLQYCDPEVRPEPTVVSSVVLQVAGVAQLALSPEPPDDVTRSTQASFSECRPWLGKEGLDKILFAFRNIGINKWANFSQKPWRARSRLYRSQILQVNMH